MIAGFSRREAMELALLRTHLEMMKVDKLDTPTAGEYNDSGLLSESDGATPSSVRQLRSRFCF